MTSSPPPSDASEVPTSICESEIPASESTETTGASESEISELGDDDTLSTSMVVALGTFALLCFMLVLALHGLMFGQSQATIHHHIGTGAIECLRIEGWGALDGVCDSVGLPVGQPFLTGLSLYVVGLPFAHLPLVSSSSANVLVQILTDAAGFLGGYLVARRLGALRLPAILAATGYLSSLSIVYLNGYVATFNGFVLIPIHVFIALKAMDAYSTRTRRVHWSVYLFASATFLSFTEGYAFMAGALVTGTLWVFWLVTDARDWAQRAQGALAFTLTSLLAAVAYMLYAPGGTYEANVPIEFFRGMGADVSTFVLPQKNLWWSQITDVSFDFRMGWGDASAYRANYLGIGLIVLGGVALARSRVRGPALALAVAAAAALVLALGPSLKVHDLNPRDLSAQPTAYLMPAEEATLGLPTSALYEYVPGFTSMRATYRWIILTTFCLFQLGAVGASMLYRSGRRGLAIGLGCIALIEVFPYAPNVVRSFQGQRRQIVAWEAGPIDELPDLIERGERLLFLPANNDLLANELTPRAGAKSYNIGGDKGWFYAKAAWPESVVTAIADFGTPNGPGSIDRALSSDVDAVAIPYFDLRNNALIWPPSPATVEQYQEQVDAYRGDDRFEITDGEWFAIVRRPAGD